MFLISSKSEAHCSYKIVLIKKKACTVVVLTINFPESDRSKVPLSFEIRTTNLRGVTKNAISNLIAVLDCRNMFLLIREISLVSNRNYGRSTQNKLSKQTRVLTFFAVGGFRRH